MFIVDNQIFTSDKSDEYFFTKLQQIMFLLQIVYFCNHKPK